MNGKGLIVLPMFAVAFWTVVALLVALVSNPQTFVQAAIDVIAWAIFFTGCLMLATFLFLKGQDAYFNFRQPRRKPRSSMVEPTRGRLP